MFNFNINQPVHHKPTDTRARVVGLHKDRNSKNQIEIEYKTSAGEIKTNWVAEAELDPVQTE